MSPAAETARKIDHVPLGAANLERVGDQTDIHTVRVDKTSRLE
jgi:hypothetical protein